MTSYRRPLARMRRLAPLLLLLLCVKAGCHGNCVPDPTGAWKCPPPRLALLIGIGDYVQSGPYHWRTLHVQKEIAALKDVLTRRYEFPKGDVHVLLDRKATRARIRAEVKQLIKQARPGATIVLHFSGHGQPIPDDNKDEADGLDESLVPYDSVDERASAGSEVNIRDDEVERWVQRLSEKMTSDGKFQGSINLFIDSCFSGSAARGGMLGERGRGWKLNLDGERPGPPDGLARTGDSESKRVFLDKVGNAEVLAAAQGDQTAREDLESGVFSRALVSALERATPGTTYRELFEQILFDVRAVVPEQSPKFEGQPNRLLFGGNFKSLPPYVPVVKVQGDLITLPIGAVHLATAGSVYTIYRGDDTPDKSGSEFGEAELTAVRDFESDARMLSSSRSPQEPSALRGARAVEKTHAFRDFQLRVRLEPSVADAALTAAVQNLDFITSVKMSGAYDVRIFREGAALHLQRSDSGTPFRSLTLGKDTADRIVEFLRAEWRWRRLYTLKHSSSIVQVGLKLLPVDVETNSSCEVGQEPRRRAVEASTELTLVEGEYYQFEVENRSSIDVYVTILELGPDGSITTKFPYASGEVENVVPAKKKVTLPLPFVFRQLQPYGRSLFKAIATFESVNFSPLIQEACLASRGPSTRSAQLEQAMSAIPAPLTPLAALLSAAMQGQRGDGPGSSIGSSQWASAEAWLDLRPVPQGGVMKCPPRTRSAALCSD